MSHLQKLYAKYRDKGLVVLGVNTADAKEIAAEMLAQDGVDFPNVLDPSPEAWEAMQKYETLGGRSAVPMTYLIDREGKVFLAWYGYDEGHRLAMAALITKGGQLEQAIARQQLMIEDLKLLGLLQLVKLVGIVPDLSEVGMDQPPKVEILPGSLAEKAGIRSGDRITALNGQTVKRVEDVPAVWSQLTLHGGLRLSLQRDGSQVEVTLADWLKGLIGTSNQETP